MVTYPSEIKRLLSGRFSRFHKTYDRWAVPQRESAKRLVEFVNPEGSVLDVGCGTGFVSRNLSCGVVGVDISENMIKSYVGKSRMGVVGDAESLPFKDAAFDFALSSFALHWTYLPKSVAEMVRVSSKGVGIALPVEGSLRELGFPFPSREEVISLFSGLELSFFEKDVDIPYRGWDLLRFLHYTGTMLNPRRKPLHSRKELEDLVNSIKRPLFRVIFLYARL